MSSKSKMVRKIDFYAWHGSDSFYVISISIIDTYVSVMSTDMCSGVFQYMRGRVMLCYNYSNFEAGQIRRL
jgi:hypothetical protein